MNRYFLFEYLHKPLIQARSHGLRDVEFRAEPRNSKPCRMERTCGEAEGSESRSGGTASLMISDSLAKGTTWLRKGFEQDSTDCFDCVELSLQKGLYYTFI